MIIAYLGSNIPCVAFNHDIIPFMLSKAGTIVTILFWKCRFQPYFHFQPVPICDLISLRNTSLTVVKIMSLIQYKSCIVWGWSQLEGSINSPLYPYWYPGTCIWYIYVNQDDLQRLNRSKPWLDIILYWYWCGYGTIHRH